MTEITRKTSYKDAKAIFESSDSSPELKTQANERMQSIKDWLDSRKEKGGSTPNTVSSSSRRSIEEKDFSSLTKDQIDAIAKDTSQLLDAQLARIYFIEQGLKARDIASPGVFTGMLYNNQILISN